MRIARPCLVAALVATALSRSVAFVVPSSALAVAPSSSALLLSPYSDSDEIATRRHVVQLDMVSTVGNSNERRERRSRFSASSIMDETSAADFSNNCVATSSSDSSNSYAPAQAASLDKSLQEFWMPVISTSLLITGNTFGAGSLVLPELVQGPGLSASSGIFMGAYLMNLLSGLCIAEVAIQQKERNGTGVPSSFKEMVEENLNNPTLATFVSSTSFCVNALVFSFVLSRVGLVAHQLVGTLPPALVSAGWGAALVVLLTTQSSRRISNIASLCVTALFASFGSLLLPGLARTDAIAAWTQPATAADPLAALGDLAPVILMALIFQNIVPTITRLHGYNRTKTVATLVLGSALPLVMYLAWCVACLGGGIDLAAMGGGMSGGGSSEAGGSPLLAIFSLATLSGSSIGCGLSCASELETFWGKNEEQDGLDAPTEPQQQDEETGFQLPSALATVALPLSLAVAVSTFGDGDLTPALSVAGGLGSPLLYGVLPVWMAWNQRQENQEARIANNMVPSSGLGFLGALSTGMFGTELIEQVGHLTLAASSAVL